MKLYEKLKKIVYRRNRNRNESQIDYEEAKQMMKHDKHLILVDVRSPQEYKEGHLEESINIPLYDLEKIKDTLLIDKGQVIIIYCQSGSRSRRALEILKKDGYQEVYHIKGGLDNI